jgi:predicted amidohydrolase
MKIAAAQISCALGDVTANLAKVREYSERAKGGGAELVVFPEMTDTGYSMPVIQKCATTWKDGAVPQIQKIAGNHSIAIVCGLSEKEGDAIYNSQVVVDSTGKIVAKYRKIHLFGASPNDETKCFSPGRDLAHFECGDLRFGLSICYDLRFPEIYRKLALDRSVNAFAVSSAWPFARVHHFQNLAVARAIENQCYMVAVNRVGIDDGVTNCGSSAFIDPYGVVIAAASPDREELLYAELSADIVNSVRNRINFLADRRPDLY